MSAILAPTLIKLTSYRQTAACLVGCITSWLEYLNAQEYLSTREEISPYISSNDYLLVKHREHFDSELLPGVQTGKYSSNTNSNVKKLNQTIIECGALAISNTNKQFAASTREGLIIFESRRKIAFDPNDATIEATPENVQTSLQSGDNLAALCLSLRINQEDIVIKVLESIPNKYIDLVLLNLPDIYLFDLLKHLCNHLPNTVKIELHLTIIKALLKLRGNDLEKSYKLKKPNTQLIDYSNNTIMNLLQRALNQLSINFNNVCDSNKYNLQILLDGINGTIGC